MLGSRRFLPSLILAVIAMTAVAAAPAAASTFQPDRSFGSRGIVTTKLKGVSLQAFDAVAAGGGKLVVVGRSFTSKGVTQVVVARYLKNGTLQLRQQGHLQERLPLVEGAVHSYGGRASTAHRQDRGCRRLRPGVGAADAPDLLRQAGQDVRP